MTIATDREGENVAFGITTPIITPRHSPEDIKAFCNIISQKLASQLDASPEDDQMSLPVPVHFAADSSFFEVQETALLAAMSMTRSLKSIGYTVVSCTPAAMSDRKHTSSEPIVSPGYVLVATRDENVDNLLSSYTAHPAATLWTEYASAVYGQAAVNRAMDEMQDRMRQMMADSDQSVH